MIIPIGTDNPLRRKPMMNYILIVLNIVIFLATYKPYFIEYEGEMYKVTLRREAEPFKLYPSPQFEPEPQRPHLYQYLTYAFLHANWLHILGNMLFLYIFGNNVNDKLGDWGYLLLYLGGGVASGIGHVLLSDAPVLGASGAVAAITGAYMVLFPKTYIHVLYIIFFIGTVHVPALYFILFKLIIYDNILEPRFYGGGNIAYEAHLAGYLFGVGIPLAMLALRILPHSHFDLWALIERRQRRREYQKIVQQGYEPFDPKTGRRKIKVKVTDQEQLNPHQEQIIHIRSQISQAIYNANLDEAVEEYLHLLEIDENQVMPQQHQLDIANKLMQVGNHPAAAEAYEKFLHSYRSGYPFTEQIELMLGLIYARYLHQKPAALKYLQAASQKLNDPGQKQMCEEEIKRLNQEA